MYKLTWITILIIFTIKTIEQLINYNILAASPLKALPQEVIKKIGGVTVPSTKKIA